MTEEAIWQDLTAIFRELFEEEALVLSPEMTADEVEAWDSLSNVQLFVTIEQHFGVRFSTGEIANLKNVGELAAAVAQKTG